MNLVPGGVTWVDRPSKIGPMSESLIAKVRVLEEINGSVEQVPILTKHLLHAGMYARSITIPAGVMLTGALIKRPTILILSGDAAVVMEGGPVRITGYAVIPASAHRKQVFVAHTNTHLTMLFPTSAQDVETAENEFTDEAHLLFSRYGENDIQITGEL